MNPPSTNCVNIRFNCVVNCEKLAQYLNETKNTQEVKHNGNAS